MKCPYCGTVNAVGEDFCANCGAYLHDAPASDATIVSTNTNVNTIVQSGGISSSGITIGGGKGNSTTLVPNARLQSNRYVVERILGQGGMGAAVLARDTRVSNKLVVIKELISEGQDDVRNFEREVETLAQLRHPYIPTVTDSFQEGSRYYMVQEYAPGENLEDFMDRTRKPMPQGEALTYISQVLDILIYLSHRHPPIVHRDIKPANIIIDTEDKHARLVDFGIARADEARNARKKQTSALGTPGYAPPEQYQGNADVRSDMYALAATLHHLVTNRDPRDFPPFNFPSVLDFNGSLSPELDALLKRELTLDANKRYQTPEEMKREVDAILHPAQTATVLASSPLTPPPASTTGYRSGYGPMSSATGLTGTQPHITRNTPPPPPPPPIGASSGQPQISQAPYPFPGTFGSGQKRRGNAGGNNNNHILWSLLLLIIVVIIIGVLFFALPVLKGGGSGAHPINGVGSGNNSAPSNPISTMKVGGETIGLSYGATAFDLNRSKGCPDCSYKVQAGQKLQADDPDSATALWRSALSADPSDAEAAIYLADQQVLASSLPHVTIVVGTMLTGNNATEGRDGLQGAYVAQAEYNANNGALLHGVLVRILVANAGSSSTNVNAVAQQIVEAHKQDPTIVAVMGWPFSSYALKAARILGDAKIPVLSSEASGDDLSSISPYFFRIAPSNQQEALAGAQYARTGLKATTAVVFLDPSDSYSQTLGDDFTKAFSSSSVGGTVLKTYTYTIGNQQSVVSAINQLLALPTIPNLIYFSGYAGDVSPLLSNLYQHSELANTRLLGGDALYELGAYTVGQNFKDFNFTAFAYPDEWNVMNASASSPAFFQDYSNDFGGSSVPAGTYGYNRTSSSVMLAYDATGVLLAGIKNALNGSTATPDTGAIQTALAQITGTHAFQGVTGQISFGGDGNVIDKPVLVLSVDNTGHIHMLSQLGAGKLLTTS